MPKLWSQTIEAHRRQVRDAVMDTAAQLAGQHGPLQVNMSQVAEQAGIGRATLYKYFASVEQILHAWHERQIAEHLTLLTEIAERDAPPMQRLTAVLETFAQIQRHRTSHGDQPHGAELAAFLHGGDQTRPAEQRLRTLIENLITVAAADNQVRSDVNAAELTTYCLHALDAARALPSAAATKRLVGLIIDGLHPHP